MAKDTLNIYEILELLYKKINSNTLLIESQKETIRLQKERITQLEETSNAGLCYNPNHK